MNVNSFRFFLSESLSGFIISGADLQVLSYRNRLKLNQHVSSREGRGVDLF